MNNCERVRQSKRFKYDLEIFDRARIAETKYGTLHPRTPPAPLGELAEALNDTAVSDFLPEEEQMLRGIGDVDYREFLGVEDILVKAGCQMLDAQRPAQDCERCFLQHKIVDRILTFTETVYVAKADAKREAYGYGTPNYSPFYLQVAEYSFDARMMPVARAKEDVKKYYAQLKEVAKQTSPTNRTAWDADIRKVEELVELLENKDLDSEAEDEADDADVAVTSKGESESHALGTCRPCHYVYAKSGCTNGAACAFCHLPHPKKFRPRPCKSKRSKCKRLAAVLDKVFDGDPDYFQSMVEELSAQGGYLNTVVKSKVKSLKDKTQDPGLQQVPRVLKPGSPYFSMTTENESSEQSSSCISLAIRGPCFALSSTGSTGQPAEGRPFQCFGGCDDPAASRALEKDSFIIICSKLQLPEAPAGSAVEHGDKSWTTWRGAANMQAPGTVRLLTTMLPAAGGGPDASSSSNRFGRVLSDLASAGREVRRVAQETRDAMVLLRHTAKHGEQASAGYFTEVLSDGSTVQVEVIAAADLSMGSKSLPVPYCALATGYRGQPWAAKASGKPECNTPPALRQRHPRWNALCKLQLPKAYVSPSRVEFCKDDSAPQEIELSVRVMDAGGLRGDRMAGEARIPLSQARGAGTFRLLGGGYASLSVRWSEVRGFGAAQEPSEPSDFAEFEEAMCFWSRQDLATPTGVQRAQRELQTKLAAADRNLVNELLLQTPLSLVLSDDEASSFSGSQSLLRVLSEHLQSQSLSPLASSRLIGALVEKLSVPRSGIGPSQEVSDLEFAEQLAVQEAVLCKLILRSESKELLELKRLVDAAGGGRDLRHLIYSVISDQVRRESLLQHFVDQAGELQPHQLPVHILSDIDMTVWVGTFGAGGPKFPAGPVPGALPLFTALGGRVTFLSARPPIWEGQTRRLLVDDIGIAEAVVLPGSLKAVAQVLFAPEQARQAMAERKTEVFGQFATLHPEARFVFIGDSGEGDVDFAEEFMGQAGGPARRAALIHDVVRSDGVVPKSSQQRRADLRMRGIRVFDTYAGAALELFQQGLLDMEGLRCATHGCLEEFAEINPDEFASVEVFETRRMELLRDVREVNAALRAADEGVQGGAFEPAEPSQRKALDTLDTFTASPKSPTGPTVEAEAARAGDPDLQADKSAAITTETESHGEQEQAGQAYVAC
ncbi:unnamed protein product [Symbiodinium sp. KB8]|nr:unnamed protein product [Symbiodinium sp. KB8]